MGKNQEKRHAKRIKHARQVWAKKQIIAADFWNAIKEAEETFRANTSELSESDIAQIEVQIEAQRQKVHEYLVNAHKVFVDAVGEENSKVSLEELL
jgi:hypothetical protein